MEIQNKDGTKKVIIAVHMGQLVCANQYNSGDGKYWYHVKTRWFKSVISAKQWAVKLLGKESTWNI